MNGQDDLPISRPPFKTWVFLLGLGQLGLGVAAVNWVWKIWYQREAELPAVFWGALALTFFLFGIAQINLVGPFRDRGTTLPAMRIGLPYRLKSLWGGKEMIWPMLSIAVAFGLPVIPMVLFTMKVEGNLVELRPIWLGVTLLGLIIGGVALVLGVQKVYERFVGSSTIVEVSVETVRPGEQFSVLVRYVPGKLAAEELRVKLICWERFLQTRRKTSGTEKGTRTIYEEDIQASVRIGATTWQKSLTVRIPGEARLSTSPDANPSISWAIEVTTHIPNAPDITETFVFTVDDPDLRAQWEAEADAE